MSQTASQGQAERLRIHRLTAAVADDFAADVREGLTAPRKFLRPKYFYDELGSRLFDAICLLPEYYLTRAEAEIFAVAYAGEVALVRVPGKEVREGVRVGHLRGPRYGEGSEHR